MDDIHILSNHDNNYNFLIQNNHLIHNVKFIHFYSNLDIKLDLYFMDHV